MAVNMFSHLPFNMYEKISLRIIHIYIHMPFLRITQLNVNLNLKMHNKSSNFFCASFNGNKYIRSRTLYYYKPSGTVEMNEN